VAHKRPAKKDFLGAHPITFGRFFGCFFWRTGHKNSSNIPTPSMGRLCVYLRMFDLYLRCGQISYTIHGFYGVEIPCPCQHPIDAADW